MNNYPKRLIEVDLPIKRISAHARREKSIRHGHISTLHIWWARRPLAACRAVVCASLWPDPADEICPSRFVEAAKRLMRYWGERHLQKCSADSYPRFNKIARTPTCLDDVIELRKALLDFIADFANWDNSTSAEYLAVARTLTVAAHDALETSNTFSLPESISIESINDAIKDAPRPLLVDPFAGGGSIPLEAIRCGSDSFASDLNPVPILLNRIMLEDLPKYGNRLVDNVEACGKQIEQDALQRLHQYYPAAKPGETPLTYIWARKVSCEGPGCGVSVPLIRSLWLSKKGRKKSALKIEVDRATNDIGIHILRNPKPSDVMEGTVRRSACVCPRCGYTTNAANVRKQISTQEGGANSAVLICVLTNSAEGPMFREPTVNDIQGFERAKEELLSRGKENGTPTEELPYLRSIFNVNLIGADQWGKLFNYRQLLALLTLIDVTRERYNELINEEDEAFARAVLTCLAFAIDRCADYWSSLCVWAGEFVAHTFGRQALGIIWDYAEVNGFNSGSGSYGGAVDWIVRVLSREEKAKNLPGQCTIASACEHPLPNDSAHAFFTDPPYYDAVPYADLSDYFYVWLKRSIGDLYPDMFKTELTPKQGEVVQLAERNKKYAYKTKDYFETLMKTAMEEGRRVLTPNGIGTVVFAHKTAEGWETQISAMIHAGWCVTGSWPIDTERPGRLRANDSAALASSIHLVCRPREDEDGNVIEQIGDWRDVLSELPGRISAWLPRLASEGVVGADAIFACIGPALEIFSRYSSVEKASGEVVPLREYLEHVWAEVARQALNMIFEGADASGFEEDARLTAMWLWTLRTDANGNGEDDEKATSLPGYTLEYDAARKIAQGLGCHLENLTHLVEVKGDKAMLLSAESRARYLFGKEDVRAPAKGRKKKESPVQLDMFSFMDVSGEEETSAEQSELERPPAGKTALDQLHQAMLLFTAGRGAALKRFLVDDGIGANPQFWTLAQALSALYPSHTNEKRWVDGVLARKKGLGL